MDNQRMCYFIPIDGYVPGEGYRASVVVEGQPGHRPTGNWPTGTHGTRPYFWGGEDYEAAELAAKRQNERLGLTERDVAEIVASSMGASMRADVGL